jgi:hypothetical protein
MSWEVGSTLKQAYSSIKRSAMCVQRLDDSRSAVRITYRISLRSSSSQEPRYPLLKVVAIKYLGGDIVRYQHSKHSDWFVSNVSLRLHDD